LIGPPSTKTRTVVVEPTVEMTPPEMLLPAMLGAQSVPTFRVKAVLS